MLGTKKAIIFWSAIGVPGGGTGIYGGYYLYDRNNPTGNGTLNREGYTWNIPSSQMGFELYSSSKALFQDKEPHGCFQNFFPGAKVDRYVEEEKVENKTDDLTTISDTLNNGESSQYPIGCALMDFSFLKGKGKDYNKWSFNAEITVKNDKFGWALWVSGRRTFISESKEGEDESNKQKWNTSLWYSLVFLKKEVESWNAFGGYVWADYGFSSSNTSYKIKAPAGEGKVATNWFDETNSLSQGQTINKQYSGVWTKDEANGKGIFEEIEVWTGNDGDREYSAEILGMSGSNFSLSPTGYNDVVISYDKGQKKWIKFSREKYTGEKISPDLIKFYAPFKNKKGKWTEFSEVRKKCNGLYYSRSNSEEDINYLKSFCYKKIN